MELIYALPLEICLYIEKIKSKMELHDELQRAKIHLETNFIRYPLLLHHQDQPLFYPFFAVTAPFFFPTDDYEFLRFRTKSGLRISRVYSFTTSIIIKIIIKTSMFKECVITDAAFRSGFRFYNHKDEIIKHYKKKVWKAFYDFQVFYTLYLNVYVTYLLYKRYFK
jgi:hypothetical protein